MSKEKIMWSMIKSITISVTDMQLSKFFAWIKRKFKRRKKNELGSYS